MNTSTPAQELVEALGAAIDAGALAGAGTGVPPGFAAVWAALHTRLRGDRTAEAILTLFEGDAGSSDLQSRLAAMLAARFDANELHAMLATLRGTTLPPQVRSRITADQDARIQGSGHRVIAPSGSVDLQTQAGKRGQIVDSPITIVGTPTPPIGAGVAPVPGPAAMPPGLSTASAQFTQGYALLIGIGSYQDRRLSIAASTTSADAQTLAELLRDPQRAAYPQNQVQVLLDPEATRTRILDAFVTLAQRLASAPGSTALIFFAGHGEPVGPGYALLPYDTDLVKLAETTISADLFHDLVAQVRARARRLVVLLNCCHAGGVGEAVLGEGEVVSGTAPPPEFYRPLAIGSGQVVISSSRPGQKSGARSQVDPRHSTFGAQLIAALAGRAPGQGPAIGVFELFSDLRLHVPIDAATIRYRGAPLAQEPLFYASQLDDNIAVALRPPGTSSTLGGNPQALTRLIELELQIEAQADAAPPALIAERDALLNQLAQAGAA